MSSETNTEAEACSPVQVKADGFNKKAIIPFGCKIEHIKAGMEDFVSFLGFINEQLATRKMQRLESFNRNYFLRVG